jgi:signal transduction histidine kinase
MALFDESIGRRAVVQSAALLGGSYLIISSIYIVASGHIAQLLARDMAHLAELERIKGLVFVVISSLYLSGIAYVLGGRIWAQGRSLAHQREALLKAEHRVTSALLASSLTHDFNNVLVSLSLGLDELKQPELSTQERVALVTELQAAVAQGCAMTTKLMDRMRERGLSKKIMLEMDVRLLAQEAVELAQPLARRRGVSVTVAQELEGTVRGDAEQLRRAVANLVVNAVDAAGEGGQVELRVVEQGEHVVVEVHDSGPGFPEDAAMRLAQPFYTTKDNGTGLGLFSARVCAEQHRGRLELGRSAKLGGACVRLVLADPFEQKSGSAT